VHDTLLAVLLGVGSAAALMAVFLAYQKWRFSMFEPAVASAEPQEKND
jgi:hypothetical protein